MIIKILNKQFFETTIKMININIILYYILFNFT